MVDPRVKRTQQHVLATTRRMLNDPQRGPLTLAALATEAEVSRRTLYVHWGTIEKVISAAIVWHYEKSTHVDVGALSSRQKLRFFLEALRDGINEPSTNVAIGALVYRGTQDETGAQSLLELNEQRYSQFVALLGPISKDHYSLIAGPIFTSQFLYREAASDHLVEAAVEIGMHCLGLED